MQGWWILLDFYWGKNAFAYQDPNYFDGPGYE